MKCIQRSKICSRMRPSTPIEPTFMTTPSTIAQPPLEQPCLTRRKYSNCAIPLCCCQSPCQAVSLVRPRIRHLRCRNQLAVTLLTEIGNMDTKPAQNIQDSFLNTARKDKAPITIYLLSGVKLT